MQICVKIIPLSGIHNGGTIENGNPEKQNFEEWLCCSAVMNLLEIEMIHLTLLHCSEKVREKRNITRTKI